MNSVTASLREVRARTAKLGGVVARFRLNMCQTLFANRRVVDATNDLKQTLVMAGGEDAVEADQLLAWRRN